MRTNLLHITFDMHIGGTEQVITNLVEFTDSSLINVSILCLESPIGPFGEKLQLAGYTIDSIARREGFDYGLIFKIRTYLIKNKIDVIHCHQYTPWVYGALASFLTGIKVIFTEHGRFYPDSSSLKRKIINPFLVMLTDNITSISEATKLALIEYENIPASKIKVIYNGIAGLENFIESPDELRKDLCIPKGARILGTIARLDPIKNHKLLISAFDEINKKYPETILIIVGDGVMHQDLEKQVAALNLDGKVVFTGYQSNPVDYLQLMDMFLLTSLSEGTAITLLEAMSLSKACVVTDVGGNPEIIKHQVCGLVTANDNKEELVSAISLLLSDSELKDKFALEGKVRFENNFKVFNMRDSYMRIYQ